MRRVLKNLWIDARDLACRQVSFSVAELAFLLVFLFAINVFPLVAQITTVVLLVTALWFWLRRRWRRSKTRARVTRMP